MYKCASFFAGVGGIDLGFEQAGFKTIYANEFDPYPTDTFDLNFTIKADRRDIRDVKEEETPDCDIIMGGFPCQAFSVAGYRQGFNDEKGRGTLFFELMRFVKAKKPRVVFLENVKNLVAHDNGNTFKVIIDTLAQAGYYVTYKVMNAMEYGNVPQTRERIYIVAFNDKEVFDSFKQIEPVELTKKIGSVIDFHNSKDSKYYYTSKCPFYAELIKSITRQDTVYQWRRRYVRENKSNVIPTLTANMGTGGHNVPLILCDDGRIRKLTPRECFNAMGFPEEFVLPDQVNSRLYKQAGNSVVVPVIYRIAYNISNVLKVYDKRYAMSSHRH